MMHKAPSFYASSIIHFTVTSFVTAMTFILLTVDQKVHGKYGDHGDGSGSLVSSVAEVLGVKTLV